MQPPDRSGNRISQRNLAHGKSRRQPPLPKTLQIPLHPPGGHPACRAYRDAHGTNIAGDTNLEGRSAPKVTIHGVAMYWVYENYTHSRSLYHRFDCSKCREAANSRFQWHLCKTIKEAKEKSEYLARKGWKKLAQWAVWPLQAGLAYESGENVNI